MAIRCCTLISRWFKRMGVRYVLLIAKHPAKVAAGYFLVSTLLTAIGLYFGLKTVSHNPHQGFETRGTQMANERLMLSILAGKVLSPQKLTLYNRENTERKKRDVGSGIEPTSGLEPTESTLNFTINYDEYGGEEDLSVDEITSGCAQYFALGKYYPKNAIDLLSKVIFQVESFDAAFSLNVMRKLCELDDIIEEVVHKTQVTAFKAGLPYSFNLPHYALCVNSTYTKKCEHLNQPDLDKFKKEILKCADEESALKGGLCNTTIAEQIRNFIIEKGARPGLKPIHIGAILRVQLYPGASTESLLFYNTLFEELRKFYLPGSQVQLKGINMNFKEQLFLDNLLEDCYLAALAIFCVVLVVVFSHNIWFSITLVIGMLLSIGVAFFIYVVVLQIRFFPFINLLAVLIAIAISFDNGFLLAFQYRKAVGSARYGVADNAFESHFLSDTDSQRFALKDALAHAGFSMFVADFTTVIAFLTNCSSNIIVLKCFGVFAALTIATNFVFAIIGMPALIMLIEAHCPHKWNILPFKWSQCMNTVFEVFKNFNIYTLPRLANRFKLAILIGASILLGFSVYSMIFYPGIRLPDNNPMQLLRSTHPFEWFDENELKFFDFSHFRMRQMNFYAIWGLTPARGASEFNPSDYGTISNDAAFKIDTIQKLERFEQLLQLVRRSTVVESNQRNASSLWLTELVEYVKSNKNCGNRRQIDKDDFNFGNCAKEFAWKVPVFGFPDDFSMNLKDGPLFDSETKKLIGYFMIVPSRHRLLFVYSQIQPFIHEMNDLQKEICASSTDLPCPIFVPSEFLSKMADLLSILLNSTSISILICVGISMLVILGTTRHFILSVCVVFTIGIAICAIISVVLWLGWYINVVEATIVIITIGLSFDYTLHMAVAFKTSPLHLNTVERMTHASGEVHAPIFLAALTNSVGGIVLIWAKTQPFYEIGVFLLAMACISYIAAILVFPAFVFCFYGFKTMVKRCD